MIRKLKYIRYSSGFVLFSEPMKHSEIKFEHTEPPISAGFYFIRCNQNVDFPIEAICYDKSISLGLESKPEDSELLTNQLNQQW